MNNDAAVYCHLGAGTWHRVISQSEAGVVVDTRRLDFDSVWQAAPDASDPPASRKRDVPWGELEVPLPDHGMRYWGYAFTYKEHTDETLDTPPFRFRQRGPAAGNSGVIPYRDHLDFELEVGLLMHRDAPNRFGYFLVNDMTDRGVQVMNYSEKHPAPGFAKAKGFDGALRAGPLLVVADASLWPRLTASLSLNGEVRQTLDAADCKLDPERYHREVFERTSTKPWAVVATGTSGGTLFRVPRTGEKIRAFIKGGLSMNRAKHAWLRSLRFLLPGDELELQSPLLGRSHARLVKED